ncbi:hypothetical protein F3Y22_tig00110860pilonHSYRG00086 [Hibiscus syriacus]|uniref:Gnk2-homologous domain-containing protein n=1 Tax=Hibiscus syriacus TaxID=106335 RepID=A0A6A2ZK77_HIBSY|nr:hypothetical protein F3Y22_tig00110860pilonHSYRG00086 [Hibiscus syriacus]
MKRPIKVRGRLSCYQKQAGRLKDSNGLSSKSGRSSHDGLAFVVHYSECDPFATSLAYVLEDLETVTPKSKGYNYFNISPYPNAFAYGHAACNQSLTTSDCAACLSAAETAMFGTCQNRIGSRSVLHDCTIRYEQYAFDD